MSDVDAGRPDPVLAATPVVSVVVPTHNRSALLGRLLQSLLEQDHPNFEIIVVDDASDDDTVDVLRELGFGDGPGRLRAVRLMENNGAGAARNVGWKLARAPLIAFIDDDCVATPSWLRMLCSGVASGTIVQGRTTPAGDLRSAGIWAKSQHITKLTMRFETCNLLMPKAILEETGGFDERFGFGGGEDTDLGWRALERGATAVFAHDAHALHVVWDRTFREHLRDRRRWASLALLVKKHPGARRLMPLGFLFKRAHGVVIAGTPIAIVLVSTGRWLLVPAGIATWTVAYTIWRGSKYGPVPAAVKSVGTLITAVWEVFLFTRSSIRFRTLLL